MLGLVLIALLIPLNIVGRMLVARYRDGDFHVRLSADQFRGWGGVAVAVMLMGWGIVIALALAGSARGVGTGAGLGVFGAGAGLITWAQFAMGASWRIGIDHGEWTELVVGGPFRAVRNPIYLGMALSLVGIGLVSVPALSVVPAGVFLVGAEVQVRLVEEPYLHFNHPEYRSYAARVGRFLPGVGRLPRVRPVQVPVPGR